MPGRGGDKHPPDSNVEKTPQPQVGQIWRQDFEKNKEPGFYKILRIHNPDDYDKLKYVIVRLDLKTKKRIGGTIHVGPIRLTGKYELVAENENEFFEKFSASDTDQPPKLISVEEVEDPDTSKEEESEQGKKEEKPEGVDAEANEERERAQREKALEEIRANSPEAIALFEELHNPALSPEEFFAKINSFNESHPPKDDIFRIYNRVTEEIGPYRTVTMGISYSGDKHIKFSGTDDNFTPTGETPREPDQPEAEEPIAPPAPEAPSAEPVELTPEQQKRRELGGRLGLTEEQLAEREALEKVVDEARGDYVTSLYEHEQKLSRVLSILSLKRNPEPDGQYKERYDEALKNLQQFDITHLQEKIAGSVNDKEGREASAHSYTERYTRLEAVALWTEQQEMRIKSKQDGLEKLGESGKLGKFIENTLEKVNDWAEKYQKLPTEAKVAIGVGLALGHAGIAFASAPAAVGAASLWFGAKIITGTAAYKTTNKFVEQIVQKGGDKIGGYGDERKLKKLSKEFEENIESQTEYLTKLNEVALKNIEGLDKKLASYEKRSFYAKAASLTLIFGVPLSRYIGDLAGVGAVPPEAVPPAKNVIEGVDSEAGEKSPVSVATDSPENASSPQTPEKEASAPKTSEGAGPQAPLEAEGTAKESVSASHFEAVPVSKGDNLWNLVQKQLPEHVQESEKNRVTASVQNLIHNKIQGLTDAQIKEQYGFSSKDIGLIKEGEVIKLDKLVSKAELDEVIAGKVILPVETEVPEPSPESSGIPEKNGSVPEASGVQPDTPTAPEKGRVVAGFKDTPLSPRDQYWIDIRDNQGNYQDSPQGHPANYTRDHAWHPTIVGDEVEGSPNTIKEAEALLAKEGPSEGYTYEMSTYQNLPAELRPLWRENMTLLHNQLFDINNTELGPDYQPGKLKSDELWRLHRGRDIQGIIMQDHLHHGEYDPRERHKVWEARRMHNRYTDFPQLPNRFPEPTLKDGPDWRAIHAMDQVKQEYAHNIANMQRKAYELFGDVALPLGDKQIGRDETVQEFMTRLASLIAQERAKNPDFRFNFNK